MMPTLPFAFLALAVFAFIEVLGTPVEWWLYLSLVPFFAIGLLRRKPLSAQLWRFSAFVTVVTTIAALYFVPWGSRKPFLRDLYSIKPGMTEMEVDRIMGRYMKGTGWPAPYANTPADSNGELTIECSLVFRHSNDGAYNADFGIIALKNGKVTGVSFSPD